MRHLKSLYSHAGMSAERSIFLGIDCGATTSKVGGIDAEGNPLNETLRQNPTASESGPEAIVDAWIQGADSFLRETGFSWENVAGVGLAIPGPYQSYGVLGRMPNMPLALEGWHFLEDLGRAVKEQAGGEVPVSTANDGLLAGVAEAAPIQRESPGGVLMLSPGSGLGCSFVDRDGKLLAGDHQAGVVFCHMPAPYERLGLPAFTCGCGRDWGCNEAYTAISGLPQYLEHFLPDFPNHPISEDNRPMKKKVLDLRELAQKEDPLALAIFQKQAEALGYGVAAACMAYDPSHVVIGGGLMDREATTQTFRSRYLQTIQKAAGRYLWGKPEQLTYHEARWGELSQAIGAALLARQSSI